MQEESIPSVGASAPTTDSVAPPASHAPAVDVKWVWQEVIKRVFIKMEWTDGVDKALKASVPLAYDQDVFVVGLSSRDWPLSQHLNSNMVHNIIENILRTASGHPIRFEVIEGTTLRDWEYVQERRQRAHDAVVAMAARQESAHHVEDVLSQIVGEIRHRISALPERALPQVKARLILDISPSLADAEDMLFPEPDSREAKRAMGRVIDRIAGILEIPAITLALEIERHRRGTAPKN